MGPNTYLGKRDQVDVRLKGSHSCVYQGKMGQVNVRVKGLSVCQSKG